jgi:transposase
MKRETQKHATAFAYYLQLGGRRSYVSVADRFDVSETSVRKWARSFDWKSRVADADAKANAEQTRRAEKSYIKTVEDFSDLKYRVLEEMRGRVNSECSIADLVRMLHAVKTELGEPNVITKGSVNLEKQNPFQEIIEAFFPAKVAPQASTSS